MLIIDKAPAADGGLIGQLPWRKSTRPELVRTAQAGDLTEFGRALRRRPVFKNAARWRSAWGKAADELCPPLLMPLWSRNAFEPGPRSEGFIQLLTSAQASGAAAKRRGRLEEQLSAVLDVLGAWTPFDTLCGLTLLVNSGPWTDEQFARLWLEVFASLGSHEPFDAALADADDQHLLAAGELPYLAGLVFADLRGARKLKARGARVLREHLLQGTDDDGVPAARLLQRLPLWLAPLLRTGFYGEVVGDSWIEKRVAKRFEQLVACTAALCRSSGEIALGNGVACAPVTLLRSGSRIAQLRRRAPSVRFLDSLPDDQDALTPRNGKPRRRAIKPRRTPIRSSARPSLQSDGAQLACLRNNWGIGADACVVAFDGSTPRIDLTAFGVPVLSGAWIGEVSIDGGSAIEFRDWECVCWFTDKGADYAEFRSETDSVELLRQTLLSRTDHFLYVNDVVRVRQGATCRIESRLPLTGAVDAVADALSREWQIRRGGLTARLLPLGLPQESVHSAPGRLSVSDDAIVLTHTSQGPGLSSPLFLDWSPVRRPAPVEWSPLVVAESGRALSRWDANGYWLRLGDFQWLMYHGLTEGESSRSVLGLHTFDETAIGEFTTGGDFEPIVVVEYSD